MSKIIFGIWDGEILDTRQAGGQTQEMGVFGPLEQLNEYEPGNRVLAVMGWDGFVVYDERVDLIDMARAYMDMVQGESCGKCVPCRVGGRRMLEVLTRITEGQGTMADLDTIKEIADGMSNASICALGQLTPGPVMAALRYFYSEFEAHILDKHCPAGSCVELVRAPCVNACPAGVDVPSYVSLVSEGKYAEALEIHRERNPFALVCGRVCPAFCERRCRRGELDDPVSIRQIKRYMADHELGAPWTPTKVEATKGKKVTVIGGGPAGLTAALRLAQWGYDVTVHEAMPEAGGMMAWGIPDYRLPRDILRAEIENIQRAGVKIITNSRLGRDITIDGLLDGNGSGPAADAVVLAIGAWSSRNLRVPGEDKQGVMAGIDFLRQVAMGQAPDLAGKKVAVVGGGNTAIDAARTAIRLGAAEVHIVYRRTRLDMPATDLEIEEAVEEGLQLHFLVNPTRIVGGDKVEGLELIVQELGEFDASARRRPSSIEGSEFVLPVDVVIPAIGQGSDIDCAQGCGVEFNRDSTVKVTRHLGTDRQGVFACGDVVLGPATVVEAVAQGNRVAQTVDEYLMGGKAAPKEDWLDYTTVDLGWTMEDYAETPRVAVPVQAPDVRRRNWQEVELGFSEQACRENCKRCLRCDIEK